MAGALIGALRVTLGLDSAEFTRGAKKAQVEATMLQQRMAGLRSVAGGLAAGLAAVGVTSLITNAFAMASALQEAAQAAGVTVEQLQRLRFAAAQNGSSAEQMDAALSKLSAKLGEAKSGSASAQAAFATLGISMQQLKNLNTGDAFALIAQKIAMIKDSTLQAAYAKAIFGKSFATLMPLVKGGTAALDEATAASKRNGEISTENAEKLDKLADSWESFKTRISIGAANIIASLANGAVAFDNFFKPINQMAASTDKAILDWALGLESSFNKVHDTAYQKVVGIGPAIMRGFGVAGAAAYNLISSFANLNVKAAQYVASLVTSVSNWIGNKLSAVWNGAISKIKEVVSWFDWMDNEVVRNSYVPDMVEGVNHWFGLMEKGMVGSTQRATESATEMMAAMRDAVGGILDRLFPEATAIRDVQADIDALNAVMASDSPLAVSVYRAALEKLKKELAAVQQSAKETTLPPLPNSYGNDDGEPTDIGPALDELEKKLPKIGGKVKTTFTDMARHVQNTAATIANAISDMQGALSGFVNSIKRGDIVGVIGGIANVIGSVLGAVKSIKSMGGPSGGSQIPAYAKGTSFHPGGLAMVGERGRELVQLPRGSKVFPNGTGPGMGGGMVKVMVEGSQYFDARVTQVSGGVVANATPSIMRGGAGLAQRRATTIAGRRLA